LCAQSLERARLYEGQEAARVELEARVLERTQQLQQEIDERRAVQRQLETLREEERKRIARELHDELGGALTSLKLGLARLRPMLPEDNAPLTTGFDAHLLEIDETIRTVRRLATALRPAILDDFGLLAAIEWLAQDFQTRAGVACYVDTSLAEIELGPEQATAAFRMVQESLTNVGRHAGASQVTIAITAEPGRLALSIRDNGKGFVVTDSLARRSLGLSGMHERVEAIGGRLSIDSAPEQGTTLAFSIPMAD
jgi:two-component system, NarL family, sensor histidine kinase UhpB